MIIKWFAYIIEAFIAALTGKEIPTWESVNNEKDNHSGKTKKKAPDEVINTNTGNKNPQDEGKTHDEVINTNTGNKNPQDEGKTHRPVKKSGHLCIDIIDSVVDSVESGKSDKRQIVKSLSECFIEWCDLPYITRIKDGWEKILGLYTKQDKIKDTLESLKKFLDSESCGDVEYICAVAYNNHIAFVENCIRKMKAAHTELKKTGSVEKITATRKKVCALIRSECMSVSSLAGIPEVIDEITRAGSIDKLSDYDKMKLDECSKALAKADNKDADALEKIKRKIKRTKDLFGEYNEEAEKIYNAIIACFTDEWLNDANPNAENSKVSEIKSGDSDEQTKSREIIKFYKEKVDSFFFYKEKIDSFFSKIGKIQN